MTLLERKEQDSVFKQQLGRRIEPKGYCSDCNMAIALAEETDDAGNHKDCKGKRRKTT